MAPKVTRIGTHYNDKPDVWHDVVPQPKFEARYFETDDWVLRRAGGYWIITRKATNEKRQVPAGMMIWEHDPGAMKIPAFDGACREAFTHYYER